MKIAMLAITVAILTVGGAPALAATGTQGQVLLKGFYTPGVSEDIKQFNMATGVVTTDSYIALLGYHGIQLRVRDRDAIRLLVGEYFDAGGLSGMLSVYYILQVNDQNTVLTDVEYWHPVVGKRIPQVYGYVSWDTKVADKTTFGIATEHIVDVGGAWQSAAVGPTFGLGPMYLWANYDFRPALPDGKVMLRLVHIFQ